MKVSVDKNFITITFEDHPFFFENKVTILKERYFVFYHGRWDFKYNTFREYLIKNGERGCFLSAEEIYFKDKTKEELKKRFRDWRGLNNIDIWDLSLVFKDVDFIDNSKDINNEIERILTSNIIKRF